MRRHGSLTIVLLLVLSTFQLAASSSDTDWRPVAPPDDERTWVVLDSEEWGNNMGLYEDYTYTLENSEIVALLTGVGDDGLYVGVRGDLEWEMQFTPDPGQRIQPGLYEDFGDGGSILRVTRGHSTCTAHGDWFAIDEISFAEDGSLQTAAVRFALRCHEGDSLLRGAIAFDADAPVPPPSSPAPVPTRTWRPAPQDVPPSDGAPVVVLESEADEYVGAGQRFAYVGDDVVTVSGAGAAIEVAVRSTSLGGSTRNWDGAFAGPDAATVLEAGFYDELTDLGHPNPRRGGLDWSGHGRTCSADSVGWMVIDDIAYDASGVVTRLEMRFAQRCHDEAPALYGYVSWNVETAGTRLAVTGLSEWPDEHTNATEATFAFRADQPVVGFECQLDDGPWTQCASPWGISGLDEGQHHVGVRSVDEDDRRSVPAAWSWTVDTTAPDIEITEGPRPQSRQGTERFMFAANEPGLFQCRLDGESWLYCTSPKFISRLGDGHHVFEARAIDLAGNVGQASEWSWQTCRSALSDPVCYAQATVADGP